MMGGRSRRSKKGKSRKSRKMRGGNFYGAAVDPQLGSAGLARPAVANSAADAVTGRLIAEPTLPKVGGRRRRRTAKKVPRKSRRRTMRGGASWYSPSTAGGSFVGNGSAGLANLTSYAVNRPGGGPTEGPDGVMRV